MTGIAAPAVAAPGTGTTGPIDLTEMGWTAPDGIDVPECGLLRAAQKEPSAMSVTMIGLDTSKAVFRAHGVDGEGRAEVRRKLRRNEVVGFFEAQPACTVVLEACGAAHHRGRVLAGPSGSALAGGRVQARPPLRDGSLRDGIR